MALDFATLKKDDATASAFRVVCAASNGHKNHPVNNVYKTLGKADKAADQYLSESRARNCKWATAEITPLFEDKDTGMLLPHESKPALFRGFGMKISV